MVKDTLNFACAARCNWSACDLFLIMTRFARNVLFRWILHHQISYNFVIGGKRRVKPCRNANITHNFERVINWSKVLPILSSGTTHRIVQVKY